MKNDTGFMTALSGTELGRVWEVASNQRPASSGTGQYKHLPVLAHVEAGRPIPLPSLKVRH